MNNLVKETETITSMEVAEMVGKTHNNLMKDIRNYCGQLDEVKIHHSDFFAASSYTDKNERNRPCFAVTKKGCEFIAHKLTGVKGTAFTAKYINRFHDNTEKLAREAERAAEEIRKIMYEYSSKESQKAIDLQREISRLQKHGQTQYIAIARNRYEEERKLAQMNFEYDLVEFSLSEEKKLRYSFNIREQQIIADKELTKDQTKQKLEALRYEFNQEFALVKLSQETRLFQKCLGAGLEVGAILEMSAKGTGSFTMAWSTKAAELYEKQFTNGNISLSIPITDTAGNKYVLNIPKVELTASLATGGKDDILNTTFEYTVVDQAPTLTRTPKP